MSEQTRPEPHTLNSLRGLFVNGSDIVSTYKDALDEHPIVYQIVESAIQWAERAEKAEQERDKLNYDFTDTLIEMDQIKRERDKAHEVALENLGHANRLKRECDAMKLVVDASVDLQVAYETQYPGMSDVDEAWGYEVGKYRNDLETNDE